jgi:S-adenosylmethionine hydrolase
VTLVDITHAVPPQNIRHAALVLSEVTRHFPPNTVHVAVVDPGVGTEREIVYVRFGPQQYVAPDNGLLSHLALGNRPSTIRAVTNPAYWLPTVSHTFHGRDIMAPVAARLTLGLEPEQLGPPRDRLVELAWPEVRVSARKIEGAVQAIDSFGNLITNITAAALADVPRDESLSIVCDEHETRGLFETYADQPEMTFMALIGSSGYLELAIVGESAALMLGVPVGSPVVVSW